MQKITNWFNYKPRSKSVASPISFPNLQNKFKKAFSYYTKNSSKKKDCKNEELMKKNMKSKFHSEKNTKKDLSLKIKVNNLDFEDTKSVKTPFKRIKTEFKFNARNSSILENSEFDNYSGKSLRNIFNDLKKLTVFQNDINLRNFVYKKSIALLEEEIVENIQTHNNLNNFGDMITLYEKAKLEYSKFSHYSLEIQEKYTLNSIKYSINYYQKEKIFEFPLFLFLIKQKK